MKRCRLASHWIHQVATACLAGMAGSVPWTAIAQAAADSGSPMPAPAPDEARTLPPMMVTATRSPAEPFDVPYAGDLVGPVVFEERLPRTTPEALRDLPSVMLQKTGHGQGSPFIRGFTGFRTLMMIDGIRLNNSTYRDGPNQYWNTVDNLSINQLEVVRGPASVLYGSDAIGGAVNALPKSRQSFDPGFHWNPFLSYRFSSAEDSHAGRAEVSLNQDERVGIQTGASFKSYGDLRGGDDVGEQPRTGYDEWDADARVDWKLNDCSRLTYGHQTVDLDDAWRTHATIYGISWDGTAVGTDRDRILDQFRNLDYLRYAATGLEGAVEELEATLSYHVQNEQESRLRSDLRRESQATDVGTLGFQLQAASPSRVGRWTYGTEYYHDWVDSSYRRYAADGSLQLTRRQGPVADDSGYDLLGAYAQNHLPFARDRFELNLGGRLNYASADARRAEDPATRAPLSFDDSWFNAVGSARLLWHVDDARHWNLFAGISQGFRAPNLSDLTRFDIARSGEQEVPAFDLDPEQYVSVEAGAKARYGRFAAEAAYYHTLIDDLIVRVPTGASTPEGLVVVDKENSGDGFVQGFEVDASAEIVEGWTLWANLTWVEGRLETPLVRGGPLQKEPVSRLMPTTVNYGLRWEHPSRKYWAEFAGTSATAADLLSSSDQRDTQRIPPGGTPGYDVFHLRAGWRPVDPLTLALALENLADADYRIHGSGLNEPGRNLIVSATVRF